MAKAVDKAEVNLKGFTGSAVAVFPCGRLLRPPVFF